MSSRWWRCARWPAATGGRKPGRRSPSIASIRHGTAAGSTKGPVGQPRPQPPRPSRSRLRQPPAHQRQRRSRGLHRAEPGRLGRQRARVPQAPIARPLTTRGGAFASAGRDLNIPTRPPSQNADAHPRDGVDLPRELPGRARRGTKHLWGLSSRRAEQTAPKEGGANGSLKVPFTLHPCPRVPLPRLRAPPGGRAAWPPPSYSPAPATRQSRRGCMRDRARPVSSAL
jgi:hypothetical protein